MKGFLFLFFFTLAFSKKKKSKNRDEDESCHSYCRCNNQKKTIICYAQGIIAPKFDLEDKSLSEVVRLDLRSNQIEELPVFPEMPKLNFLQLQENAISLIEPNAFNKTRGVNNVFLNENHLTRIEKETFSGLLDVKLLSLSKNKLDKIENFAFVELHSLITLSLSDNFLDKITPKILEGLEKLKTLELNGNQLRKLHKDTFSETKQLKNLDLSENLLTEIPAAIRNLEKLVVLALQGNKIGAVEMSGLEGLQNLEKLDLSNNLIKSIHPKVFIPTPSLTLADFSGNEIKVLEPFEALNLGQTELSFDRNELVCDCGLRKFNEWVKNGPNGMKIVSNCFSPEVLFGANIVELNQEEFCSPDDITTTTTKFISELFTCPEGCSCASNVYHVNCIALNYREIPAEIGIGTKLLDLRLNKLEVLEELEFAGLNYLESLHLDLNQIMLVKQGAFRGLKKLIYLYLSQNNIKYLMPGCFEDLENISYLYLSHNSIIEIPMAVFRPIKHLYDLQLQHNQITKWKLGYFEKDCRIRKLDLSYNNLTENAIEPHGFIGLEGLDSLILDHNDFTKLPTQISSLEYLETLSLVGNSIDWVKNVFSPSEYLKNILLQENNIQRIEPDAFRDLAYLTKLDLTDNPIQSLPKFEGLDRLRYLRIPKTNIQCTCKIKDFKFGFLDTKENLDILGNTCSGPENMVGRTLESLTIGDICPE
ncbi:Oidioi.mRNA.OKI2018_I69.PAR.g9082.t1.cds [Oikopleura dioica]|uniref:Oidioi.mRNA.OKI2018_I69.PAR.g9082.t1.cds n=1 Tax=Oikopleura dioica TaxID=34765 RepID=A0ABN7RIW9_OIKDI|nr:Oidioi.mRNA.OKI2018_I69.PAR.g9082.t1.cds [Oikopleura dioica]